MQTNDEALVFFHALELSFEQAKEQLYKMYILYSGVYKKKTATVTTRRRSYLLQSLDKGVCYLVK